MSEENPGVELYRKDVYICKTGKSAATMGESLTRMVNLALKLTSREKRLKHLGPIVSPSDGGYFPRGIVKNQYAGKTAAQRGLNMLLAKIQGKPFNTELEVPKHSSAQPAPPMGKDLGSCEIALISDGGLAPQGNPDGLRGRNNVVWAAYEIERFFPEGHGSLDYEVLHTGYFPIHVLENPHRLVPVDVMRDLERERIIGRLHPYFYSTSGNATIQNRCRQMGEEISAELKGRGVDGVILTST
jgi:glycine reductase